MGLFSSKKIIVVSSTVYNMAGEEANRPIFLKNTMFSALMSPYDKYLGETLVTAYLTGPGMRQRQVFNWAVRNDFAGLPTFSVRNTAPIDLDVVRDEIPVPSDPAGLITVVQEGFVADGDYEYFAERYMLENHPELINSDFASEYDATTHEITIQFEDGSVEIFDAGEFDANARFVVANFYFQLPESPKPVVEGTLVEYVVDYDDLPSLDDFVIETTESIGDVSYDLAYHQTVTRSYSNGDPDVVTETDETETIVFNTVQQVYTKTIYMGGDGVSSETSEDEHFYNIFEKRGVYTTTTTEVVENNLGGGVIETVTTVKDGDHLRSLWDYRIDIQTTVLAEVTGGNQMFIYKIGTGNAVLDALDVEIGSPVTAEFYPFIPVRLNNVSITDPVYEASGLLAECKKIYKKATGKQTFLKLVEEVEDNDDIGEIDYSYVVYAVCLNTKDKSCKKYLYTFFRDLIPYQNTDGAYMAAYIDSVVNYEARLAAYAAWVEAQENRFHPFYGTPRPEVPRIADPETTTIQLKTDDPRLQDFDNRITWSCIIESSHTGLSKPDVETDEYWFEKNPAITWNTSLGVTSGFNFMRSKSNSLEMVTLYHQTSPTTYTKLVMYGLMHQNFIYGGKAVKIGSYEALDDTDESGFLVPLHQPTVREMGIVHSTQMATANTYIVFNSYKIYKRRWYQTFLGMLFIILVIVVAAAIIAPGAVGGISGAFGTNATLGASFGLTGTSAIVAGAVVNALAAVLISTVLSTGATALFGEKWGALIGAILGFAFSFGMGGGFSNLSTLFSPANLLSISSALANGYAGYVQYNIGQINDQMFANQQAYEAEMDKINKMIAELGGTNGLNFNPMQLTEAARGNGSGSRGSYTPETLDEFIHRTTLTGSDIVDITLSLITDYAKLNLQLPKPVE